MNKALVIVDMQQDFLAYLPKDMVSNLIGGIKSRAIQANEKGWKVIPVEYRGFSPTIPDLTFPFSQKPVMKNMMGGGKQILDKFPELEVAELVGVYSNQCVMSTASGLASNDVLAKLNLDLTLPCTPDRTWKRWVKEEIECFISRYHKDTPGLLQIV